jgi:hypothetical protein
MKDIFAKLRLLALLPVALAMLASPLAAQETQSTQTQSGQTEESTYTQDEILEKARGFFGETTEGLAEGIAKVFEDQGRPNAYIIGEEASGAIGVGLRYGRGELNSKLFGSRTVYWQGPSVGFDLGGNASRNMTLIYNLQDPEKLFQRFPGVDGSLYFIAGLSINYQRSGDITLAPIRTGVGLRAGASIGYLHYTKEQSVNPF